MQFSILERLMLFNILPVAGNFVTLRTIRQLREALTITEDEQKAINFTEPEPGQFKWDVEPELKEIAISDTARQVIIDRLTELDAAKQLTMQHYSLYERFIGGGNTEAVQ